VNRLALLTVFVVPLACHHGPQFHVKSPIPKARQGLISAARQRLAQGDPRRADALAQQALDLDPDLGAAHAVLAETALLAGDARQAFNHRLAALADGRDQRTAEHLDRIPLDYLGRDDLLALERVLLALVASHPDHQNRAEALSFLVQVQLQLGQTREAHTSVEQRGLIRSWRGIGGFDNEDGKGFDVAYPPELKIELDRTYVGSRGKVRWRSVDQDGPEPALELEELFYPVHWNTAYLVTYVKSSADLELVLEITTSAPIKVWVNDRNVLSNREIRRGRHRQFRIPVEVHAGFNKLLVKSCAGKGQWRVGTWFASKQGDRVDLPVVSTPQPYRRDGRVPLAFNLSMVLPESVRNTPKPPKNAERSANDSTAAEPTVARALALSAAGLWPTAIETIDRHLMLNPADPVALLAAARLHQAEGQLQQASQLLRVGQQIKAPFSAAFWIAGADLFRTRGQHDKAFDALRRAADGSPGSDLMVARRLDQLYEIKAWNLDRCQLGNRLRREHPDWVWPVLVLARCNGNLSRPLEQIRWLQQAVNLSPASEGLRGQLAAALLRQGRCSDAIAIHRGTTQLRAGRGYPMLQLARALRSCGQIPAALQALERCITQIPSWPTPYQVKGEILYERGEVAQAIAQWDISLEHNPDNVKLWDRVTHLRPDRDPVLLEFTPSEKQIAEALARGSRVRPVEGSSIIWLMDHEVARLMPDGTLKRVVTTIRRAVDRSGRDAMGEASLPRSGLVKVLEAFSINRNGQRREVTSMHGRKVRYPTLEEGAMVVLQYRHIQRPSGYLRQHLATNWLFQHNLEQALYGEWILALPPDRKLNIHIQGDVSHQETARHGLAVHRFAARDVPPLRPEPRSLPARDLLRTVSVSTVPSWDYFSEWGNSLTTDVFAMDPNLRQTLEQLTRANKTVPQRIDAVYHFALTSIRYQQDYETFIAGVKPHTASTVLARGYGDCKDKSVLIIAMLRAMGIKANLALVRTHGAGRVLPGVPSQQFNHAVAYVPPQSGVPRGRFLDATAENLDIEVLRPDDQGTLALILFPEGYRLVPIPYQLPENNWYSLEINLELDAQGSATAVMVMQGKGVLAGQLRRPLQNDQILRQYAQSMVHQLYPDCSLTDVRITGHQTILKPLAVRLKASCPQAARSEEGQIRLRPPQLLGAAAAMAQWTERRHPLYLGPPDLVTANVTITLPDALSIHAQPPELAETHPCTAIHGKWEQQETDGRKQLRYRQRVRRTCPVVTPEQYPSFRAALNKLKRYVESDVVLAEPAKGKAPRAKTAAGKGKGPARGKAATGAGK